MKLRQVVVVLAVLLWTGCGLPPGPGAANAFTLKVATISPEGTSLTKALRAAAAAIHEKSHGRVRLKIYPGGVMGTDSVVLRKIRLGQLHGGTFTSGGIAKVDGNFQILGMPMLLRDYREVDFARKKYEPRLLHSLEKKGFISTGIIEAGFAYMMSNKPIAKPGDLKGQKVWVPEGDVISRTVFEKAGIHPIPLPITDVLTGLQTHLIDTVTASPVAAIVLQWFTKVKYLTDTPLLYNYGTFVLSKRAWKRVPRQDRAMVLNELTRRLKVVDRQNRKDNEAAKQTLKKQGIRFVPVAPGEIKELQRIADEAIGALRNGGNFDYRLYQEIERAVRSL